MKRTSLAPKLGREVVLEAGKLSNAEARFLVSDYYTMQEMRKRIDLQNRHLGDKTELNKTVLMKASADSFGVLEDEFQKALKVYAEKDRIGQWCMSFDGVGPVLAAGFLAHLDITKAPTAGHFWQFSGLNPLRRSWSKGEKRPYNAELKQLTYHMGECFKRIATDRITSEDRFFYARFWRAEKQKLIDRNEAGEFAERAKSFVLKKDDGPARKAINEGRLPAFNLDRQAGNHTAKMFLSHLHALMYWHHFNAPPPKPFAIAILGHAHEVRVPNTEELFPGFADAYYGKRNFRDRLQSPSDESILSRHVA